jgi:hypothetical protein
MEKDYGNDMYGSCDFDQMKNKIHCSVCHGEGHTINRHKQGLKRNPRARPPRKEVIDRDQQLL